MYHLQYKEYSIMEQLSNYQVNQHFLLTIKLIEIILKEHWM